MIFKLVFATNTILLCSFLLFLITDLYYSIPEVIAQIFNLSAELGISTGIPTKEVKEEVETHSVIAESKITNCLM